MWTKYSGCRPKQTSAAHEFILQTIASGHNKKDRKARSRRKSPSGFVSAGLFMRSHSL